MPCIAYDLRPCATHLDGDLQLHKGALCLRAPAPVKGTTTGSVATAVGCLYGLASKIRGNRQCGGAPNPSKLGDVGAVTAMKFSWYQNPNQVSRTSSSNGRISE